MAEPPSDTELFKRILIIFIVFLILSIIAFAVSVILGSILLIGAIFFLIIYLVKPELFRKNLLEIWEKQQAKKNK